MYTEQDIIELFNNLIGASREEEIVEEFYETEGLWVSDRIIVESRNMDVITKDNLIDVFKNNFPNIELAVSSFQPHQAMQALLADGIDIGQVRRDDQRRHRETGFLLEPELADDRSDETMCQIVHAMSLYAQAL